MSYSYPKILEDAIRKIETAGNNAESATAFLQAVISGSVTADIDIPGTTQKTPSLRKAIQLTRNQVELDAISRIDVALQTSGHLNNGIVTEANLAESLKLKMLAKSPTTSGSHAKYATKGFAYPRAGGLRVLGEFTLEAVNDAQTHFKVEFDVLSNATSIADDVKWFTAMLYADGGVVRVQTKGNTAGLVYVRTKSTTTKLISNAGESAIAGSNTPYEIVFDGREHGSSGNVSGTILTDNAKCSILGVQLV
ncbi:hypothetical protein VPHK469_0234 [Vibrio phage K469]